MAERAGRRRLVHGRAVVLGICLALLGSVLAVVPTTAHEAGTVLFENLFNNRTVDGTGTVTKPSPSTGTNGACLSAAGNTARLPLLSCTTNTDAQGSGKLGLTNTRTNQVGGVHGATSFPTSNGLDLVQFLPVGWQQKQMGIAFALAAGDPANPSHRHPSARPPIHWATRRSPR